MADGFTSGVALYHLRVIVQILQRLGVCFCLAVPVPAAARVAVDAEVLLGGGRDSGLFGLAAQLPPGLVTDDYFFEARPSAGVRLEPSFDQRLGFAYAGSYRRFATPENGSAHAHLLHGSYALDLIPELTFETGLVGATEQFTAVDSDYLLGGATFGPTWKPMRGLRLGVRGEAQWIQSPALRGVLGGASTRVEYSGDSWSIAASGRWRTAGPGWHQASGSITAGQSFGPLFGRAELRGGGFSGGLWLGWRGSLAWQIAANGAIVATYDGSHLSYTDGSGTLTAHVGGLGVRFSWENVPAAAERLLRRVVRERGDAPLANGMTLRVRTAETTGAVAVAGDFNDWAVEELESTGPGVWQRHWDLSGGRYEFQVFVDGEACVPTGAHAYRPDGFGKANAVLVVGDTAMVEIRCDGQEPRS